MNEIIKGYELAEKELKQEKQDELKNKIKGIVKDTLEKIDKIDKQEKELAEKKKVLKKDIDDLKAGRLDLIEERQKESQLARDTSVFKVVIKEIQYPPQNSCYSLYSGTTDSTVSWKIPVTYTSGWNVSNCVGGTYNINGIIKYL